MPASDDGTIASSIVEDVRKHLLRLNQKTARVPIDSDHRDRSPGAGRASGRAALGHRLVSPMPLPLALNTSTGTRTLSEHRVGYASVASDLPRLNCIEMNGAGTFGLLPVLYWDLPVLAQLRHRRLNVTGFIRAARLKYGFLSVPSPVVSKPCMRL